MKEKFFSLAVMLIFSVAVFAQESFSTDSVKLENTKLTQRVDSLEHELAYFKLSYEIHKLNTDLEIFSNGINNSSNSVQLNLYAKTNFYPLYKAYKQNYDASLTKMDAYKELINASKKDFMFRIRNEQYSDDERYLLMNSYDLIDKAWTALEAAMNNFKVSLEAYKDFVD